MFQSTPASSDASDRSWLRRQMTNKTFQSTPASSYASDGETGLLQLPEVVSIHARVE